jgi:anti-sigma-K factor RskA
MTCNEASELSASYALGALDGAEKVAFEEHLEGCPACRLSLEQDQAIVGRLPEAVKLSEPPPALKGRLMARVDEYEAEETQPATEPRGGGTDTGRGWLSFLGGRPYVFGTAMAAIIVFLVAWSVTQTVRLNNLSSDNKEMASRVEELEAQNSAVSTSVNTVKEDNVQLASVVRRQWDALAFATTPEIKAVRFDGTDGSPTTKASLFLDESTLRAMMMVTGLKPPVEGYAYQLWLVTSERKVVSLGTFRTIADGYAAWAFQMPYSAAPYYTYIVSLEPRGGSDWPTSPAVLRSKST